MWKRWNADRTCSANSTTRNKPPRYISCLQTQFHRRFLSKMVVFLVRSLRFLIISVLLPKLKIYANSRQRRRHKLTLSNTQATITITPNSQRRYLDRVSNVHTFWITRFYHFVSIVLFWTRFKIFRLAAQQQQHALHRSHPQRSSWHAGWIRLPFAIHHSKMDYLYRG